jgi:pyruvate/2-oxoglutarate dehydrogenase complex dihydrolipoamide acyltransferase (E2) component
MAINEPKTTGAGETAKPTVPPPPATTRSAARGPGRIPVHGPRTIQASEAVQQLARELGVPIVNVDPSGPDGQATEADVRRAADFLARRGGKLVP